MNPSYDTPTEEIDINMITELYDTYPNYLKEFFENNNLQLPKIDTNIGRALSIMANYPKYYFTRKTIDELFKKFNIISKDSIQAFNKINQKGIKTQSDLNIKEQYFIIQPLEISNKAAMRKNFKYGGSEKEKDNDITKIKNNINENYINVPNSEWQLGHRNPDSTDNSNKNLVLQPPIQAKYRDNFIFIDTLTKMPTPKKLRMMYNKNEIEFSQEQIIGYLDFFTSLKN